MTTVKPHGRISHSLLFIVIYFATLCAAVAAGPRPRYTVVRLGDPYDAAEPSGNLMRPWRLNNKGEIIGDSPGGFFLFRRGTVDYFGGAGVPNPSVLDINDHGVILGRGGLQWPEACFSYVLRRSGSRRIADLEKARILPFPSFFASDINNRGVIVGGTVTDQEGRTKAVIYEHGRLRELPGQVPLGDAWAGAINDRGQIIGSSQYRPAIWSNGRIHDLGLPPGFTKGGGGDINEHGVAVGAFTNPDESVGFIYRDGVLRLLPRPREAKYFVPRRLNNDGDVLFYFQPRTQDSEGNWLYSRGRLYDLTPIVARATGLPIASLNLFDMNDHGVMVGTAYYWNKGGLLDEQGIVLIPK